MQFISKKDKILKNIKKQIEKFDTIIIHGHRNPDGDCYGSQLGLKDIIQTTFIHKKVYAVGEDNPNLFFLGQMDQISDNEYQNALVFIVDCGQSRVIFDPKYKLGQMIIRIDHHLFVENIGDLEWIDNNFSSCSEMIYSFKEYVNFQLSKKGALSIYVGMITDSGHFRFERVNGNTLRIASVLLSKYGLNVFEIDQKINAQKIEILKFKGYVYQNFIIDNGFIYFKMPFSLLSKFDLNINEIFSVLNILGYIPDYPVWGFIIEIFEKQWRISIRSLGPRIDHIARQFGGGGHYRACGIRINKEEEIKLIIKLIQRSINEFHNI
ncbi:DHH family phosphoesterase [Candidatus Phytoplasma pini]|uniref:Exopolyphosphatase-related protein n=1 Tax=Candidatus Phytoplasma pini TaxID=267362 RepID=A0A559KK10_9MOLU|nr:bifunctional oligoribonuclease/PAP phosphatase NrnA [Candidatus Phytoplasma pini]TVY12449.1 Exopolyphosphatase-related protein [Candidatus Phytoplasma pini]